MAARSAPETVVKEIIESVENGERPSAAQIRDRIATAQAEAKREAQEAKLSPQTREAREKQRVREARRRERRHPEQQREQAKREAAALDASKLVIEAVGDTLSKLVELLRRADLFASSNSGTGRWR